MRPGSRNHDPLAPFASGSANTDPNFEQARRELAEQIPSGLRVDLATAFPEEGRSAARAIKLRLSQLENSATLLRACLAEDETIRYFCVTTEQVWWEVLGAGYWSALLNRKFLVLTDRRFLIIHSDGKAKPVRFFNQVRLSAIKKIKGFLGSFSLVTAKRTRSFQMAIPHRKAIVALFPRENPAAQGGVEYLCPGCFTAHETHFDQCTACGLAFKSPRTAMMRSLMFPGLGSWYAGNKALAALQGLRGVILGAIGIGMVVAGATSEDSSERAALIGVGALLFLGMHTLDALMARASAKKGLIAHDLQLPSRKLG